jgi:hypothetical protein
MAVLTTEQALEEAAVTTLLVCAFIHRVSPSPKSQD